MANPMQTLTQVWTTSVLSAAFLCLVVSTEADVWRDEFNNGETLKDAWTPMGRIFTWEVQEGFLHVQLVAPRGIAPISGLELTAFPGSHQQFTITATNMESTQIIGIALGKKFPPDFEAPFSYVFLTSHISDRVFNGRGGSAPFLQWIPKHPGTVWATKALKETKLIFNAGQFQMFADGDLRADFFDEHFDEIEHISMVRIDIFMYGLLKHYIELTIPNWTWLCLYYFWHWMKIQKSVSMLIWR